MSFQTDIEKWAAKAIGGIKTVVKCVRFKVVNDVIFNTPVDTGRARGNWQASIGAPIAGFTDKEDKAGQATVTAGIAIASDNVGSDFYIVNNLPYIRVLEYGGYPVPVKRGTYNKQKGVWEIRSEGGFSKQAPQGIVRVTVRNVEAQVAAIAANL